jgi:hypothetical protein
MFVSSDISFGFLTAIGTDKEGSDSTFWMFCWEGVPLIVESHDWGWSVASGMGSIGFDSLFEAVEYWVETWGVGRVVEV